MSLDVTFAMTNELILLQLSINKFAGTALPKCHGALRININKYINPLKIYFLIRGTYE